MLLKAPSKRRILVCAPTNAALVQLTSHLVSLVEKSTGANPSLVDIILFGSDKLMKKIDKDLSQILLKDRVEGIPGKHKIMSTQKRENFCLRDAKFVFCIPCKSSRLRNQQYNLLVIDEAANLKECD